MPRSAIITLPRPLRRSLDAAARSALFPASGPIIDFSRPPGEPALVGPDSVSWRLFKNPVALFVGGVAAVILELAHPSVRTGVWERTAFRTDPRARVQRTGLAAMMTVYGPRSQAVAMIERIGNLHRGISGVTPAGVPYRADDPELLTWVHATAGFGIREAYNAYVCPLTRAEADRFTSEGSESSRLYGATGAPNSVQDCEALFERMLPALEASAIVFDFLDLIQRAPVLPRPLASVQRLLVKAAVDSLPPAIRARLELDTAWSPQLWQRHLVRRAGALADRIPLPSSPAVQACRRLGLPDDYLYAEKED